ncbi:multidrug effflux MFS transporter [Legionella spiritensis]|uniref:Bcr/CflA family efflux transporter n=1 Tax=Legionella spiritensis TaxID=452 RepID=A0A0W0YW86_LEGSP|nr:multidrug effflux MFS transporter [Legionella spiritensis]KTD61112.1 florfenicol efflux pump [Legionella spiritensis]SNV44971.1 florfenicol efflux pump [Legionella spiritensis]
MTMTKECHTESAPALRCNNVFARLIFALTPMVLALPLAMDIYVPAIAHMARDFHASDDQMLLTLNLFMVCAGLMQLAIGPVSDHFGRRSVSLFVIACFILASIGCGLSRDVNDLILFRVLQAFGSCGMMVLGFAMVRDHLSGERSARAYSFLNGMISFSPIFATFIGSYIDLYLGWPATFWSLLLVAIPAVFTIGFWLDESLPVEKRTRLSFNVIHTYRQVFQQRDFVIYNLVSSFGHCYFYLFCALSPFLLLQTLHIPQQYYGFYFCFMGFSLLTGSFIGGLIVERLGIFKTCVLGFCLTGAGGLWMLAWYQLYGLSASNFVYPMLLIGIGGTFCMGAGTGGAMAPFEQAKGTAAAAVGASRFLFAGVVGYLVMGKTVHTTLPLSVPAIIFSLLGLILLIRLQGSYPEKYVKSDAEIIH